MQRRAASRLDKLERKFKKLDEKLARATARQPSIPSLTLKEGESGIIRDLRPPAYLWIPGGGVLVLQM